LRILSGKLVIYAAPAPDDLAPALTTAPGILAASRSPEPGPAIEAIEVAAVQSCILIADCPSIAAKGREFLEHENPP
jgi:hypothetical protein